jgi:iron complex outermembrane recepter protein
MKLTPTTLALAISAALNSLAIAQTVLPEVEVRATSLPTDVEIYHPAQTRAATRFDAEVLAVPQSSQSVTAEQISAMGAHQIRDVLGTIPSAGAGNTRLVPFASSSWTIRGLDASVTRNGFSQMYFEDVDSSALRNIERIDVVKGPSAAAQGQEGLGGVISVTTRRPEKTFAASADVSVGSFNGKAAGFDVTGALGDSGFAVRLNGEMENSGSFVDAQDVERKNVALALSFDNGSPVRGFLNAEYQQRDSMPHPGLPTVGTIFSNGVATVDRGSYLGEANVDYLKSYAPLVQAWLDIDVADGWTLSPRFQFFEFNVEQQQMNLRNASLRNPVMISRSGRYDFHEHDVMQTWQLELNGQYQTGSMQHQLLAGLENKHAKSGGQYRQSIHWIRNI